MPALKQALGLAGAALVPFAAIVFVVSTAAPSPAARLTRETLAASFESDIRNLVVEWSPDDPRPVTERRRALFAFVYQTYESSAWIPQSLFDSNLATQIVGGDVTTIIRERVGLVPWPENQSVPAFGMAPAADPSQPLMWTVNCVICHTAEIDGVAYFGAGTKVFDDKILGDSLKSLTSPVGRRLLARGTAAHDLAARANDILTRHHHDKIDSLTRARSTAFAASHVELYMRPNDGRMPANDDVGRGDVKVPPLWHTAAKMQAGRWYADGSFYGRYPLMASSMELEKDRSFETLDAIVVPTIKEEFETVVRHLRPPRYPYEIDRALAAEGRALFYSDEVGCARCHGVYRREGQRRVARQASGRRNRPRPSRRGEAGLRRSLREQPSCDARTPQAQRRVRGDAAHRRLGQLSLPSQRERPDAPSSARAGGRASEDLQRHGGPAVRSSTRRTTVVSGGAIGVAGRSGARRAVRRPAGLVQREPRGLRQLRTRRLEAHSNRRATEGAHRVPEDVVRIQNSEFRRKNITF